MQKVINARFRVVERAIRLQRSRVCFFVPVKSVSAIKIGVKRWNALRSGFAVGQAGDGWILVKLRP
jgi:hypothetical protein